MEKTLQTSAGSKESFGYNVVGLEGARLLARQTIWDWSVFFSLHI